MKEKIKLVIVFIIGIIMSAVISVYAATVIAASEVSYTSNSNTTVETGLNNLYTKANTMANNVTNLGTRVNTVDLLYSTTTYAHATSGSYNYASISNMDKYTIIMFYVAVGNIGQFLVCPYGDNSVQLLYDTPLDTTKIRGGAVCDWSNKRIGLTYYDASNMTYQNVKLYKVYGLLKRS